MTFTSLLFLFCFLPLALAVYYIAGDEVKEYVLLGVSLVFYSIGDPKFFLLFVIATLITVLLGRIIGKTETLLCRRILLVLGIAINVSILCYYKYTDFAISTFNTVTRRSIGHKELALPLGISFFTFKSISYLVDVYKGRADLTGISPARDALYLSFFAQIQSGPLTRYENTGIVAKEERKTLFADGVYRFMTGFGKKILLADVLAKITTKVFSAEIGDLSTAYAWLGSICFSLQLYYDFSGYSDIAIGLSEMFGIRCMENFDHPYMTPSVSKFWRRWHISLSQWFRDYVYIPLGGSRNKQKYRIYFNLFVVWMLTGLWHGANWNFIAWGLGYFVLIAFERATGLPDRFKASWMKALYRVFTLIFINCQWVMFNSSGARPGIGFIKRMFIPVLNETADFKTKIILRQYYPFLIAAIVFCFPITALIEKIIGNRPSVKIYRTIGGIAVAAMFIWAVSLVVAGLNNPFAYADF